MDKAVCRSYATSFAVSGRPFDLRLFTNSEP